MRRQVFAELPDAASPSDQPDLAYGTVVRGPGHEGAGCSKIETLEALDLAGVGTGRRG